MDMPARSPVDLKIALAILYINFATYNSHKRILSSSQLLLCWRKAPAGMFIDVLHDRVSGSRAKMVFTQLLQRVDELKLLTDVVEAKRLLSEVRVDVVDDPATELQSRSQASDQRP
ncbi:hypothetical protein P4110_17495 [Pseudomonas aeruginosa]|nr:hypothetical protein [Pseudomonas aeruginosa]